MKLLNITLFLILSISSILHSQNKAFDKKESLVLLDLAKEQYMKGEFVQAIELGKEGISKNYTKHFFEFNSLIGIAELKLGSYSNSLDYLNRAKEFEEFANIEQRIKLYWAIGDNYVGRSLFKEGVENYKIILSINPNHEEAKVNIGKYLIEDEKEEEALKYLDYLIANETKYESMVRLNRAYALLKLEKLEKAKTDLDICIDLDPMNPYIYDKLSEYYLLTFDNEMCCKYLTKAISMNYGRYGLESDKHKLIARKETLCK